MNSTITIETPVHEVGTTRGADGREWAVFEHTGERRVRVTVELEVRR